MYRHKMISDLSHTELADAMRELKLNFGPITSSTRRIYENRLQSHLLKESIHNIDIQKGNSKVSSNEVSSNEASNKTDNNVDVRGMTNIGLIDSKVSASNDAIPENSHGSLPLLNGYADHMESNVAVPNNKHDKMKPLINKEGSTDETEIDQDVFVGVWIPYSPTKLIDRSKPNVFKTREDALKKVKQNYGSRFKLFPSKSEAEDFSLNLPSPYTVDKMCALISESLNSPTTESSKVLKKPPTFQELMKFRRAIEDDDFSYVQQCLNNPKYMISSTDTPVILQEGTRLNAMHVTIKHNRLNLLAYFLKLLRSDEFLLLMYPNTSNKDLLFRKMHLVNLFLNTPEKLLCETPLHLACKFGFSSIVKYLLNCKEINVDARNKEGKTAKQVMCTRLNAGKEAKEKIKKELEELFQDKAFVLLYHVEENLPKVGEPIVTLSKERLDLTKNNVKAYAGPMSLEKASLVYSAWKSSCKKQFFSRIARSDYEKGMERIGRVLTAKENVPFLEYWPFLSSYANFSSPEGLQKLETYLKLKTDVMLTEMNAAGIEKAITKSLSPSSTRVQAARRSTSPDYVKKKLTFDVETQDEKDKNAIVINVNVKISNNTATAANESKDNQVNNNYVGCLDNRDMPKNNQVNDYACKCKEVGDCEQCSVDINLEELSVHFSNSSLESAKDENISDEQIIEMKDDEASLKTKPLSNDCIDDDNDESEISRLPVFIDGDMPSKHDLDVLRALENVVIDASTYPSIERWKDLVESYPQQLRTSWPSPGSPRYKISKRQILWTA